MRATWPSFPACVYQQLRMGLRDRKVVFQDGDRLENVLQEGRAARSPLVRRKQDPDSKLGHSYRRDAYVVVVVDHIVESSGRAFGGNEEGRVEQKPAQDRSWRSTTDRTAARSAAHSGSGEWRRSTPFTSAP